MELRGNEVMRHKEGVISVDFLGTDGARTSSTRPLLLIVFFYART